MSVFAFLTLSLVIEESEEVHVRVDGTLSTSGGIRALFAVLKERAVGHTFSSASLNVTGLAVGTNVEFRASVAVVLAREALVSVVRRIEVGVTLITRSVLAILRSTVNTVVNGHVTDIGAVVGARDSEGIDGVFSGAVVTVVKVSVTTVTEVGARRAEVVVVEEESVFATGTGGRISASLAVLEVAVRHTLASVGVHGVVIVTDFAGSVVLVTRSTSSLFASHTNSIVIRPVTVLTLLALSRVGASFAVAVSVANGFAVVRVIRESVLSHFSSTLSTFI